jgi:alginate O-acetyltransferase complex protein AlgI
MNVCSVEWVICLLAFSSLFFLVPGVRPKQMLLFACSASFVASFVPNTVGWIALAAFVGIGYLTARLLQQFPRKIILVLYLAIVLSAFVVFKQYAFAKALLPTALFQKIVATVGWSYMLFRQIQVAVDAYEGQIETLSLWNYLNFQLNVFGFVAGPIQHYQEFCRCWRDLAPILSDTESILRAYLRVFIGVVKIALLGQLCLEIFNSCSDLLNDAVRAGHETQGMRLMQLLAMFYCYPLYIYFNFSGYCDMVIAGASLFGLKMPENFDRPYLSRNMIDYWTRFHRTLGFWIRDYIFTPMYKGVAVRWPAKAASLAFLCYLVAFTLAGIWHGPRWNFVIYGLLNGLGAAAAKLWERRLIKRYGRQGLRSYLQDPRIRAAAIVGTVNFACFTIFFFPSDLNRSFHIVRNVFAVPL